MDAVSYLSHRQVAPFANLQELTNAYLIFASENDITDVLDNTFSAEDDRFGETVTIDLKPGGQDIAVTNENKKEYVQYVSLA